MTTETCDDYKCEWTTAFGEHSHVGIQPYLHRVMAHGKKVDGQTGVEPLAPRPVETGVLAASGSATVTGSAEISVQEPAVEPETVGVAS